MFRLCVFLFAAVALTGAAPPEPKKDVKKDTKKDDKKDDKKLTADEQAVIDFTNAERAKGEKKLPALKANPQLMEAARKHAANMAAQEKMDHVLDGKNPADRAKAAGYKYRGLGENVAAGQESPKDVVKAWMDSPPHRENIMKADYLEIGVAVVKSKTGDRYWVQVFGRQ
jgi:uncharacterized protein YkwD